MADGRVTQLVVETLSQPLPDGRVTQVVVEVLTSLTLLAPPSERVELFVWMPV